ncbi:MAG: hypothetical protein KHX03_02550 [Clostridium sp.]|nr:hypothetical protein [Clostridium sp.]
MKKNKNTVSKMLDVLCGSDILHFDKWTEEHRYRALNNGNLKQWISNILPVELLTRSIKKTVDSIVSLCECTTFYRTFPDDVKSPDYGDKWGRLANYIEINNRAIAEMTGNRCKNGIFSSMKMLPAIPPSAKSWANCIILSQIWPNIYGDGYNKAPWEENSIYGIKLNCGYSENIINYEIAKKLSAEEQFKAFNDLAHFRGLKTGFRTVISEDQLKIARPYEQDEHFRWHNPEHVELYIQEMVNVINTGFEAIFVDSAKHIGGYDLQNYTGVGALPEYEQMQYITDEIRKRTGKTTLSFVGEKSSDDFERYRKMGLNAGTAFVSVDDFDNVKHWSNKLKYSRDYAPGVEVSNDNTEGGTPYETRLNRIRNALFGFEHASDKLPSFMQMEDLFPLRYDTNTHHLMMCNPSYSQDGTPKSHWNELFTKDDGRYYNHQVGEIFAHALFL